MSNNAKRFSKSKTRHRRNFRKEFPMSRDQAEDILFTYMHSKARQRGQSFEEFARRNHKSFGIERVYS